MMNVFFKLVDTVQRFSDTVQMDFGISKCSKLTVKRGKIVRFIASNEIPELEIAGLYPWH